MENTELSKICIYHPNTQGLAFCKRCNGYICKDCIIIVDGKKWCKKCYDDFKKSSAPPVSKRCMNHPNSMGISYCKKCGGYICQDCMITIVDKKYCKKCYNEYKKLTNRQTIPDFSLKCNKHPDKIGISRCNRCDEILCEECAIERGGKIFCKKCEISYPTTLNNQQKKPILPSLDCKVNNSYQHKNIKPFLHLQEFANKHRSIEIDRLKYRKFLFVLILVIIVIFSASLNRNRITKKTIDNWISSNNVVAVNNFFELFKQNRSDYNYELCFYLEKNIIRSKSYILLQAIANQLPRYREILTDSLSNDEFAHLPKEVHVAILADIESSEKYNLNNDEFVKYLYKYYKLVCSLDNNLQEYYVLICHGKLKRANGLLQVINEQSKNSKALDHGKILRFFTAGLIVRTQGPNFSEKELSQILNFHITSFQNEEEVSYIPGGREAIKIAEKVEENRMNLKLWLNKILPELDAFLTYFPNEFAHLELKTNQFKATQDDFLNCEASQLYNELLQREKGDHYLSEMSWFIKDKNRLAMILLPKVMKFYVDGISLYKYLKLSTGT